MKLVSSNDPILKEVMPQFEFNGEVDAWQFAEDLVACMRENNGLGLSANQVGLRVRAFAMEGEPAMVCFNPRVVDESTSTQIYLEEGCLSFCNLFVKIKRPRMVKVRFQDPNGDTHTLKLDGMSARVFLHELDHLNGIDFRQRANPYHLERAKKVKQKIEKGILKVDMKRTIDHLQAIQGGVSV